MGLLSFLSGCTGSLVFPEAKGRITKAGNPVSGLTVRRAYEVAWNDEKGTDEVKTDTNGEFTLPDIRVSVGLLAKFLPHEPLILQTVKATDGSNEYELWSATQRDYQPAVEWSQALKKLNCDLANAKRRTFELHYSPIFTVCDLPIKSDKE